MEFNAEKDLRSIWASSLLFEAKASRELPRPLSLKISPATENGQPLHVVKRLLAGFVCSDRNWEGRTAARTLVFHGVQNYS